MAQIELHPDFKDFSRLLSSHGVKYLVVGGYEVIDIDDIPVNFISLEDL